MDQFANTIYDSFTDTSSDSWEGVSVDQFVFTDVADAALSTQYTSNEITISGLGDQEEKEVSITGGTYSKNGGAYTSNPGTAVNGDTFTVRCSSSGSYSTAVNVTLTVGGVSDTYTVTTLAEDSTPAQFTFTDVSDANRSTVYTSNQITVSGINSTVNVSISGGTYSKNGGGYTSSSGTCVNGDTFTVRCTSSGSYSTAVNVVLTIGGVSDTYTVTTGAEPQADTTPNQFTFTDVTGANISTVYTSNQITISGIDSTANVTISGGTYSKNGGDYTASAGTCANGDTFTVRCTSSSSYSTAVNVVLTVGGVSDTYSVTTMDEPTGSAIYPIFGGFICT